jgi:hypothetical protein
VAGQIGVDQGIGDDLRCASFCTNSAKKFAGETVQIRGVNVRHMTLID